MKLTKDGTIRINFRDFLVEEKKRLSCNFNCSYCNQSENSMINYSQEEFFAAKKVWDVLATIEDDIIVRLNFDGEIIIDKWALEIAYYVCNRNNVKRFELITNNSIDPDKYFNRLDIKKASFSCSFHPECITIERFLKNLNALRDKGCPVFVTMIITPQIVNKLEAFSKIFEKENICFRPLLLQGAYNPSMPAPLKKNYRRFCQLFNKGIFPQAYKKDELETIKKYSYSALEFDYQLGKSTKGELCYAGVDMINVFLNGNVRRCFWVDIGTVWQLVNGKVKLHNEPRPCFANACQCPAHMLGLKEFRDSFRLSDDFADHYDKREVSYA